MTRYFRHLGEVFRKAGIVVTKENRLEIDKAIHGIVGVEYHNCPVAWREVKKRLAEDQEDFVRDLKLALKR